MKIHWNQSLLLLLIMGAFSCTAQKYIPFPYAIKKEVLVDSAAVVTAHPLATRVGLSILRRGGNAVDAAVAVQFALAVVYPQAGNLGGGGFMIYLDSSGHAAALDFREKAPAAATEIMYQDSAGNVLPEKSRFGAFACGVPGSVDGMWEAHQKYGSLPWDKLLAPAILLADKGYQITEREATQLSEEKTNFIRHNRLVPVFVKMHAWEMGDWLIQKDLANTLRRIANRGRVGFYEGTTASMIESEMKRQKGLITREDLKNYHSVWRKPIEFDWRGLHIISMPPPSSGGILLQQMLGMLGNTDLKAAGFQSSVAVHLMTEAERRAFADRAQHMGDSDFWDVPVDMLVSDKYLKSRMADFDMQQATPSDTVKAGMPKVSEETTHFNIVDPYGNAVSITTTLNDSYGSRVIVSGAGFLLNNEMDDFSAKPGAPNLYGAIGGKANAVAPNKRPLSSMTPTIVTQAGKLAMAVGTPGGTTIPTSVYQVILNVFEFDLPLDSAIQSKRFHHQWLPDKIQIEEGTFSEEVILKLQEMGHVVEERTPIGRVEAIYRRSNGKLQAVADKRGDDSAGGY